MPILINSHQLSFIPFNQNFDIIQKLNYNEHKTLLDFNSRFNGLCELICNRILIDNILGLGVDENYLKNRVTVERLNDETITKSHILDVYSLFCKVIAYLFRIYPDNIFSCWNQWKLVNHKNSVNRKILSQGLRDIADGSVLKLQVFRREGFSLKGHSLLIKKNEENKHIFFDPDSGEHRGLSFSQLGDKIEEQLKINDATDLFLTKGTDYLARLEHQGIL
jgi:hypothetical protein